ncbi:MAG: flagellar motor switch protein FliN [Deltaproteobacteria bacterium]
MSERESTASNIATDLLGRLNDKLRSELVRHVDEYFQKTDFQNSLAFPNVPESINLDVLHQDSGNTEAVEALEREPHPGDGVQKTETTLAPLEEYVRIEDQNSMGEQEVAQVITSLDEKLEGPLENTDSTEENRSSLMDNSTENIRVEDQKSNSEKEPPQGTLAKSDNHQESLLERIDLLNIIDANLSSEEEAPPPNVSVDFLMEMPLKVTCEVGRTRMDIKDLISLGQGSVVELHRFVGEDLDIFVNGKLIARGELVVYKENFGAKISEIVSPEDRVKKMGGLAHF